METTSVPTEKGKTMREKLIELICSTEYGNGSLIGNNFQKGFIEKIADHLIANGVTIAKAEDLKRTASLDYEAEYEKLLEAHKRLCADYAELKHDHESMETEFVRMRAQLDIVYLIFGGK